MTIKILTLIWISALRGTEGNNWDLHLLPVEISPRGAGGVCQAQPSSFHGHYTHEPPLKEKHMHQMILIKILDKYSAFSSACIEDGRFK